MWRSGTCAPSVRQLLREVIAVWDKCEEGYIKEVDPRILQKNSSNANGMESVTKCLAQREFSESSVNISYFG